VRAKGRLTVKFWSSSLVVVGAVPREKGKKSESLGKKMELLN